MTAPQVGLAPAGASATNRLSKDEARHMVVNFVKLLWLLRRAVVGLKVPRVHRGFI
ncbi:MAG: hypothetical protein ACLPWF_00085 [Bryobacteraceae bacterium]